MTCRLASAGPPLKDPIDTRVLGRAGAPLAGVEGGAALNRNPAALARESSFRIELGTAVDARRESFDSNDPTLYQPCDPAAPPLRQPRISDQGQAALAPVVSVVAPLFRGSVGLSYRLAEHRDTAFPVPQTAPCPADIERIYPHRYLRLREMYRRHALAAGGAWQLFEGLAVGGSVEGSFVRVRDARILATTEASTSPTISAAHDVPLSLEGKAFVPAVHVGILYAPPTLPLEFAAGGSLAANATLSGRADLSLPASQSARVGARLLTALGTLEQSVEWKRYAGDPIRSWSALDTPFPITTVPFGIPFRDSFATRTAIDIEIVSGFFWLSAGYAYETGGHYHTVAAGAEARWDAFVIVFGYAKALSRPRIETAAILAPFFGPSSISGEIDAEDDRFGLVVELGFPN
jgi:hypothetical protein